MIVGTSGVVNMSHRQKGYGILERFSAGVEGTWSEGIWRPRTGVRGIGKGSEGCSVMILGSLGARRQAGV